MRASRLLRGHAPHRYSASPESGAAPVGAGEPAKKPNWSQAFSTPPSLPSKFLGMVLSKKDVLPAQERLRCLNAMSSMHPSAPKAAWRRCHNVKCSN
ncbi:hypothetical protein GEV38_17330 [Pseudomonas sp. 13159349]|nr:hypothetical protein GEV38_17330 [Pseudomonas sp. 13159349]